MAILNYSTKVAPEKTIAEIQGRLVKNGAKQISFEYTEAGDLMALMFIIEIDLIPVFFSITPNIDGVLKAMENDRSVARSFCTFSQAVRVAWRIEKDWLEAQLAKIEAGLATPLQLLLPYAAAKDGQTFYQKVIASKGKMLKPAEPRNTMTILERIGKWETTPLARLLFDLTHMGFNCKMDVYPHGCESGSMASVRIEKDGALAGYLQGSTAGILKERIVKWADKHGLRDFLKEGTEDENKKA